MTSSVDSTLPADNVKASKADFRAQFLAIKNEITALQKRTSVAGAKAFYNFVDADDLAQAVKTQHELQVSTLPADLAFGRVTL
jgi:hypothetical protein